MTWRSANRKMVCIAKTCVHSRSLMCTGVWSGLAKYRSLVMYSRKHHYEVNYHSHPTRLEYTPNVAEQMMPRNGRAIISSLVVMVAHKEG